jgi:TRAP-type C4-dicarboxylate transport system permease small subunit
VSAADAQPAPAADRAIDRACDLMAMIGFTALVVIAFLTMADVTLRYLDLPRVPGLKDLNEVAYAIVVASCFPGGLKKGNAVTVRILGKTLGPRAHAALDVLGAAALLLFFLLCGWQFVVRTLLFQDAGRTTSTLEWPTAPVWWLVSLLMAVCVFVQSWVLLECLKAAGRGVPRPTHEDFLE